LIVSYAHWLTEAQQFPRLAAAARPLVDGHSLGPWFAKGWVHEPAPELVGILLGGYQPDIAEGIGRAGEGGTVARPSAGKPKTSAKPSEET
jgi:hypothetical protein